MPGLIDKLGDNKIVVRQANTRVLKMLMEVLRPRAVLEGLSGALLHSNWRVREEAVNMFTLVRLGSRRASSLRADDGCSVLVKPQHGRSVSRSSKGLYWHVGRTWRVCMRGWMHRLQRLVLGQPDFGPQKDNITAF